MTDSQINFKNRFLAGLLGYLIPGAGHLYQGRTFKGIIYFVCIFGMFLCGMSFSNWSCVYWSYEPGKKTFGYFAQLGVGAPSLPAFFQSRRFNNQNKDDIKRLDRKIATHFSGKYSKFANFKKTETLEITGELEIERKHETNEGVFHGTAQNENGSSESIDLKLSGPLLLEKPLKATKDRAFKCSVVDDSDKKIGEIAGHIPRSFFDRFEMPLDDDVLQKMHNTGRPWELALVMTWIAGLLNILAVWDAVEGPAYGYDDKELKEEEQKKSKEKEEKKKSKTASQKTNEEKNMTTPPAEKTKTETATLSTPISPTTEAKEKN